MDSYNINDNKNIKKSLPVGISDYIRAQKEYYYVDKTMMIKQFLDRKPMVSLFTRPRRFGKTLNMDMLRVFFEKTDVDTSIYFKDKDIWKCGEEYTAYQGKYPVIFITFKDVKYDTWELTLDKIKGILQVEYGKHRELLESNNIAEYEKEYFNNVLEKNVNEVDMSASLENLSRMLDEHYGVAPIIIIDEYDTPIQEGYSKDFYDEIIRFMRNLFSGAFKDNKHLSYGFMTGIFRIAQESIFSGLNNLAVYSVMDDEYSSSFGFTRQEVIDMLEYYGVSDKLGELEKWYDGYRFGTTEIYNPWSVINYIAKDCNPQAYWANTGRNEILKDVLKAADDEVMDKLKSLLQGDSILDRIDENIVYSGLRNSPTNIYGLLLVAGYLKTADKMPMSDGTYMCRLEIPNKEILTVYKNEIISNMMSIGVVSRTTANKIVESMYSNDYDKLQSAITEYLEVTISYYDSATEGFYHGLILGLMSLVDDKYRVKSNREAGYGRFDISLYPRDTEYPGIIIEIKNEKGLSEEQLERLSQEAVNQINDRKYDVDMKADGVDNILKLGIAFSGKKVRVKSEKSIS